MWRRVLSTKTNASYHLKKHIHRLYQHIHPDKLACFPEQRLVNESSFQELQSALDRHFSGVENDDRTHGVLSHTSKSHNLTFFARRDGGEELFKAVVPFHKRNLASVLHDLFSALHLDLPSLQTLSVLGCPEVTRKTRGTRLQDLVEEVRRAGMSNPATTSTQQSAVKNTNEAEVIRLGLQRAFGVRIVFGNGLPVNVDSIMRRMARSLPSGSGLDIAPSVIFIDGGCDNSVVTTGWVPKIHLGACATDTTWKATLLADTVAYACREARERERCLRNDEREAARVLGVRMVLCEAGGVEGDEYLLRRYANMVKQVITLGAKCHGVSSIAVMVTKQAGTGVDVNQGLVRVGLEEEGMGMVTALENAQWVSRAFETAQKQRAAEERLVIEVRKAIGAKRIRKAEGLGGHEWEIGLRRLRATASRLRNVLSGVSVAIGVQARVLENGEIEIPFDFDKSMVF